MANHAHDVWYGVQKGDGVFTAREDIQLVADRPLEADVQYFDTYGPLNSMSKFYSFGYVETINLGGGGGGGEELLLPAQGTASFVLDLDMNVGEDDFENR